MPHTTRRTLLGTLAALGVAAPGLALAQAFHTRPVRLVIGFAPGGGGDLVGRPLAQRIAHHLRQTIVVENRPGANGNLAAEHVLRGSPADGYSMLQVSSAMATINPFLYPAVNIDYTRDFEGIVGITNSPQSVIVPTSLGVTTLGELFDLARRQPGRLNFASGGMGSLAHLIYELMVRQQDLRIEHIPYRGTGPAVQDMLAGRIHLMVDAFNQVQGQVEAGQMRVLAVTGPDRLPALPNVPTTAEAGHPWLVALGWQAFMIPKQAPRPAIEALHEAARLAMAEPELLAYYRARGVVPFYRSGADLHATIRSESAVWGRVIREANIRIE